MMKRNNSNPLVCIVGRANVGKSSLFNRLCGKRFALVHDAPGVTRDVIIKQGRLSDLIFWLADTAGYSTIDGEKEAKMLQFSMDTAKLSDVLLFMVDGLCPPTNEDHQFARMLRKLNKPTVLVINKCENSKKTAEYTHEYQRLGLGEPIEIAAAHGLGFVDLYERLKQLIQMSQENSEHVPIEKPSKSLVVIGRPNVGKSSLVNLLLGYDRVLAGSEAGLTRDATYHFFDYQGEKWQIVDTAGVRKRANVHLDLEKSSVELSMQALKYAETVLLMVSAVDGMEGQDLTLAEHVIDEGRNLILVFNKWDLVEGGKQKLAEYQSALFHNMPRLKTVPIVPLSVKNNTGMGELFTAIIESDKAWNQRIPTFLLNQWLRSVTAEHPHNSIKGRKPKFRYITQIKTRPPHFVLFVSRKDIIERSYVQYLENELRRAFDFKGAPIRFTLRATKNPYIEEDGKK